MKLLKAAFRFLVPTLYCCGGGGSAPANTTTTVLPDRMTREQLRVIRESYNDKFLTKVDTGEKNAWGEPIYDYTLNSELSPELKALNEQFGLGLDNLSNLSQDQFNSANSLSDLINSGFFGSDYGAISDVGDPSQSSYNGVDAQSASYDPAQIATTSGFENAPLAVADPALTFNYDDAAVSTIDKIDKGKAATVNDNISATAGFAGGNLASFREFDPYTEAVASQSPEYQSAFAQLLGDYSPANAQNYDASLANASTSDLSAARQDLGEVDPTTSLQQLLSGKIDNPYLSSINQANINQSMQGYNDMLQNLTQQVMPSIDSQAFAAGQYGGSRQGIAQGLALQQAQRNARDLTQSNVDAGNKLFGNAYQQAQDRMHNTANNLNSLAVQNAQFNTSAQNQASQFNASAQNQAGQFGADANNNMSQFNVTNGQANQKYNAEIANQMAQFNSTNQLNKGQFDTTALNDMAKFNAANALQNQQYGTNAFNEFGLAQERNATEAGIANANNATQVSLSNSNNALQQQLANTQAQNQMTLANLNNQLEMYKTNTSAENDMAKFNATNRLQNQQFNATNLNAANQFNAGQANDLAQFNSTSGLQNQQFNAGQTNELNLANSQNAASTSQFNASQANTLGLNNAQNSMTNDQFNVSNGMSTDQFNANLGLQNNTQQMAQNQQNLQSALTGVQTGQTALGNLFNDQNNIYQSQLGLTNYQDNRDIDILTMLGQTASLPTGQSSTTYGGGGGNGFGQLVGQAGGAILSGMGAYSLIS